jgi:nucleoside-diphosphate-sugar epimerase
MAESAPQPARNVVILGAGGYLGRALCDFFHALPSCRVIAVSRRPPGHSAFHRHVAADVFADDWWLRIGATGPTVLIHCAFDFAAIEGGDVAGKYAAFARNIEAAARAPDVTLIHVSSMSAYRGCHTDYGREKLWVEDLFTRLGGTNVRPGLIASWRRPGAAFENLIRHATGSRIVPLLSARGSGFYYCDLETVVLGIYLLTRLRSRRPHTVSFCYRHRLTLRASLDLIDQRRGSNAIKVPVPWQVIYPVLLLKERLIGKSKVRADSVLDFAYPNPRPLARAVFARMVAHFRADLAALGATRRSDDFLFLEGSDRTAPRPCGIDRMMEPEVFGALGRLSNP